MTALQLSPADGSITIRTDVSGVGARLGHRLVIAMREWKATVTLANRVPTAITVSVTTGSLEVESGQGGVTPLSPVDKSVIKRNATKSLGVKKHPQVTFSSTEIGLADDLLTVTGDLTINGVPQRITVPLGVRQSDQETLVTGSFTVRQTDFNVKPYSVILGQLKVADEVTIALEFAASVS